MAKADAETSRGRVDALLAEKSAVLSQAHTLTALGMGQTARLLWASAASFEERIASLLDADGDDREAAVHRLSAASCYEKAGDPSRAANLFRAALAGPLRPATRKEVRAMLTVCLARLKASAPSGQASSGADGS